MKTVGWDPYTCQICGGSLLHPEEIKKGYHESCFRQWELNNKV